MAFFEEIKDDFIRIPFQLSRITMHNYAEAIEVTANHMVQSVYMFLEINVF